VRQHVDALLVAPDGFLASRRVQFAILAARNGIPAGEFGRDGVEVGLLMNYGTDRADSYQQAGVYTARILKGVNPADLPESSPATSSSASI
jgi:putative tryptophan/tyrosine transport system substrate-binding protein